MKLRTHLGQDRFFWMKDELTKTDRANLLVEVQAPPSLEHADATPTNLIVILDRSGSMNGDRLDHAKRALRDVVDRLSPTDSFGLVTFDDLVEVSSASRAGHGPSGHQEGDRLRARPQHDRPRGRSD